MGDPAFHEDAGQSWVVDVVKAYFNVQKEGGHLQALPLQGFHVVHKSEAGIVCAQPREGAALVRVNHAPCAAQEEVVCHNYPFQELRDTSEKDYNPEGGG